MAQSRKVALVTGAATGIGRAAAVALAEAGFDVVINYSRSEQAARTTAEQARQKVRRRCSSSVTSAMIDASAKCSKRPSGSSPPRRSGEQRRHNDRYQSERFRGHDGEEWDRVFAVNVRGVFQVTRAAVPLLKAVGGNIVNTASIVGLRPGPQPLPYAASKAAVVSLTKLLALNLAPEIRVNAVAPGWMEGD